MKLVKKAKDLVILTSIILVDYFIPIVLKMRANYVASVQVKNTKKHFGRLAAAVSRRRHFTVGGQSFESP